MTADGVGTTLKAIKIWQGAIFKLLSLYTENGGHIDIIALYCLD